jgi:hypothetical protein
VTERSNPALPVNGGGSTGRLLWAGVQDRIGGATQREHVSDIGEICAGSGQTGHLGPTLVGVSWREDQLHVLVVAA